MLEQVCAFIRNYDFKTWFVIEVEFAHMNAPGDWDRDKMILIRRYRAPITRFQYHMQLFNKDTKIKPIPVREPNQRKDATGTEFKFPAPESVTRWLKTADFSVGSCGDKWWQSC